MNVAGSVVLITGGASGLGAGLAQALAARGARVAIFDRPDSAGAEVAKTLQGRFYAVDVTDTAGVEKAVAAVVQDHGRIDVCVNNAGVNPSQRVLSSQGELHPLELFRKTVDINLIGAFDVLRRCVAAMSHNAPSEEGERGLIVNVASIAALEGQAGQAAYSASKGALVALTLPLARDLAPLGIRVMSICPGVMATPMFDTLRPQLQEAVRRLPVFPKRLGTSEDFARLVMAFMETTGLNGENVRLDTATRLS